VLVRRVILVSVSAMVANRFTRAAGLTFANVLFGIGHILGRYIIIRLTRPFASACYCYRVVGGSLYLLIDASYCPCVYRPYLGGEHNQNESMTLAVLCLCSALLPALSKPIGDGDAVGMAFLVFPPAIYLFILILRDRIPSVTEKIRRITRGASLAYASSSRSSSSRTQANSNEMEMKGMTSSRELLPSNNVNGNGTQTTASSLPIIAIAADDAFLPIGSSSSSPSHATHSITPIVATSSSSDTRQDTVSAHNNV
jgi:hypothetical protein